ncbi:hypothetical protein EFA69_06445 [Rufibacter immobilis]|uniref:Uncharacterized protein n=1 Tax=Rufibacter immobilis TaxID=1348778 RepID=A0A3M9MZM2_9BACT|nr:hypothetical protein [Rufibacter immobilis]RNI30926.1 hypothetical protein EFA69_06445 [Rufibacter immobilis]
MKNYFLYLLRFKSEPIIKIGISNNDDFSRVKHLSNIYEFDLDGSYVVKAKDSKFITKLEKHLHTTYNTFKVGKEYQTKYKGKDGHTELRCSSCLDHILEDIRHYSSKEFLGVELVEGIKFPERVVTNQPPRKIPVKIPFVDELKDLDIFQQILTFVKTSDEIVKVNINEKEFKIVSTTENAVALLVNRFIVGGVNVVSRYGNEFSEDEDDDTMYWFAEGSTQYSPSGGHKKPNTAAQARKVMSDFFDILANSPKLDATMKNHKPDFSRWEGLGLAPFFLHPEALEKIIQERERLGIIGKKKRGRKPKRTS